MRRPASVHRLAPALLALASMACGGSSLAPFQPEITNATNSFQLQATGLTGVTAVKTYAWMNTGTSATVNQASAITGGTATVEILDAAGTQVYSRSLTDNGTFQTSVGSAGSWAIRMTLQDTRGTLNFRVQKP